MKNTRQGCEKCESGTVNNEETWGDLVITSDCSKGVRYSGLRTKCNVKDCS